MLRSKDLKGKLVRWALKLQEYDYSVHYRPGAQNVVPDALSRAVVGSVDYDKNVCFHPDCKGDPSKTVNWIQCDGCDKWFHLICLGFSLKEANYLDEYFCMNCSPSMTSSKQTVHKVESILPDMNRFISEQVKDPFICDVMSKIHQSSSDMGTLSKKFPLEDGVLKYVGNSSNGISKIVVPAKLIQDVITHYHCSTTYPHMGIRKTVTKVGEKFWWKNMKSDIESFIKKCRVCQFCKPVYQKPSGFMQSTVTTAPWEVLAMDLMGPFPESNDGNLYILVITDHFSKFCLLYPLKRATGKVLASILRQLFCVWGACKTIVSDNGPQMISKAVAEICILWGVKRAFTTPYHPQSN
ncbi:hypothetical protein HOLleu_34579 [Holothuria leucospilota]|uniref:Integrase catalytic domain-containing protein n=1 Tax=Holothuria leucospilota TaxID=206669 RepID=A0A9Q0YNF9_HOLLE|nr:hypothetical protein HOLleu_34579 [Holothuria leucospilota]